MRLAAFFERAAAGHVRLPEQEINVELLLGGQRAGRGRLAGPAGGAQAGLGILGLLIGLFAIVKRKGVRWAAPANRQIALRCGRSR